MNARPYLLARWPGIKSGGGGDPEILSLTLDSRAVRPGSLFVAVPGSKSDGRAFVADAVAKGAAAVLTDPEAAAALGPLSVPVFSDPNPRQALAILAARLFPRQPETVAAITGTNGKTSTASFTRQLWSLAGLPAASLGTLGIEGPPAIIPGGLIPGAMTTPDTVALQQSLADLATGGITHAAMEASSHGIDQYRLDGIRITAAAFTNLTQDHLDYHGTMAAYFAAKRRLFSDVLAPGGTAILNADIPEYAELAAASREAGHPVLDYGEHATSIRLLARVPRASGQSLSLDVLGRRRDVELPLVGHFQAMNVLAALAIVIATGMDPDRAIGYVPFLQGVRGRVERVATLGNGAAIYVDYAHTPDGLAKILEALRPHAARRLVVVFGAGGDRDRTKRPLMGDVARRLADTIIVTDDNPRSEIPAAIRAEILTACPAALEIGDRAAAIGTAIAGLEAGDVLVIAGKGHEQGQTIAGIVHPFDDAAVARAVLAGKESPPGSGANR